MNERAITDDTEDKPLDPAMERVRRKMVRLLVISIGIMMAGLMAVLYAIVYKVSTSSEPGPAPEASVVFGTGFETRLKLADGERVISHSISGAQISILTQDMQGIQTFHIFDVATGNAIGRIVIGH